MYKGLLMSALFALCSLLSFGQENMYVWKDGNMRMYNTSDVDSVTFSVGRWLFEISDESVSELTSNTVRIKASINLQDGYDVLNAPIIGICYSSSNENPTIENDSLCLGKKWGDYDVTLGWLEPNTNYWARFFIKYSNEVVYASSMAFTTLNEKGVKRVNGHKFVDLGLPSGLLWATTNVGAESPIDYGDYYAWGETSTKDDYSSEVSYWYNHKYPEENLRVQDDVAAQKWGGSTFGKSCRFPTKEEMEELINNCQWQWMVLNNRVQGYWVQGANSSHVFLPGGGYIGGKDLTNKGNGYYWTSTRYPQSYLVYFLYYSSDGYKKVDRNGRIPYGYNVRPVAD